MGPESACRRLAASETGAGVTRAAWRSATTSGLGEADAEGPTDALATAADSLAAAADAMAAGDAGATDGDGPGEQAATANERAAREAIRRAIRMILDAVEAGRRP